jgi:hypothetical protein
MTALAGANITGTVDSFFHETKEHLVERSGSFLELGTPIVHTSQAINGNLLSMGLFSGEVTQAFQPVEIAFDGIDCSVSMGFYSAGRDTGQERDGDFIDLLAFISDGIYREPEPIAVEPDTTKPVVSNFSPASGSTITKATKVSFDVTDDAGVFRRIIIVFSFAGVSIVEIVHDGQTFRGPYTNGSVRTPIDSGYHYVLGRIGGWPGSPTIEVYAIDTSGNEAG